MANIYEKSIFEFKSEITVSSYGSNFNTLIATDDFSPYLQLLSGDTTGAHVLITWSDSTGATGSLTEETSSTLTAGHFMIEYPVIVDSGNRNRLKITAKDLNITQNRNPVTVTVTFYASIKPGEVDNLLNNSPLENTTYFNINTVNTDIAAPAKMEPVKLQKFDLRVLGSPVTIDKKQDINFNAIYLFKGFTDKTLLDSNLTYRLTIKALPEIIPSPQGITVTDANTGDNIPFILTPVNTYDIQIDINYSSVKGKIVLVSIPEITNDLIELSTTQNSLYIPCNAQLFDFSTSTLPIDFSNTNVEVTLISKLKILSGGVKILV